MLRRPDYSETGGDPRWDGHEPAADAGIFLADHPGHVFDRHDKAGFTVVFKFPQGGDVILFFRLRLGLRPCVGRR